MESRALLLPALIFYPAEGFDDVIAADEIDGQDAPGQFI